MTRVLHVLDHSLPLHSGYSFRTRAILSAQAALGLDVRGITGLRHSASGPQCEVIDSLTFHRTPGRAGGPPVWREWREIKRLADAIVALAADWRPDLLHAHSPALCGKAALIAGRRLGLPVVYEVRAFWEDAAVANGTGREGNLKYRLTRGLENHVVKRADQVVTICRGLKDDLVRRGVPPGKITISPNGVDLALFGTAAGPEPELARALCLGPGPVIGFIGSFYDYEGLDDLIAAMPLLQEREPGAQLLLVGSGPQDQALRQLAVASPAGGSIHFAGSVPHSAVDRYYALIDVLAFPRKQSRLTDLVTPLKPLEAMAQGRLVAASDVGGHRELIHDGLTGTLFAPDDPAACAAALADLLAAREIHTARRAAARNQVRTHHDWATNVLCYQDVYQTALTRTRSCRDPETA
ncbi:MAG: TIGR04063 family PEP-CTERM/XrtA system glycosyltransferase [Novosphingobium sp.]